MRPAFLILLFLLACIAPPAAHAQTSSPAKALLGASATAESKPDGKEAPAAAPAIIPGSPLAALAKATSAAPAAPSAEDNAPAPFGTGQIGFVITTAIGDDTVHALRQFVAAVHDATRLTPVAEWLDRTRISTFGQAETKSILKALLVVTLPAALVDAALQFVLRRPAARCAQWAVPRYTEDLPAPARPLVPGERADDDALPDDDGAGDTRGLADAEAGALEPPARRHPVWRGWGRRLSFALLNLLLALVPVAGFIFTALLLLTMGIVSHRAGSLAATGVGNAYFVCRLVQELARFLVNPAAPSLRLIAMPSSRAQALMNWLVIVLATVFFGASLISCALVLGMPHSDAEVLTRFVALAVHMQAAVGIWRCRALVAGWITGDPAARGSFGWLRRHLGRSWHIIALVYILALWLAWTAGVQNAFVVLLRSVLVLVTALVVGAAAWRGSAALLERLLAAPATGNARHPNLLARIRVYGPLLSVLLRAAIAGIVLLLVLQGWGFDTLDWLRHNTISQALLSAATSVLTTSAIALALWEAVNFTLHARIERLSATGRKRKASRLRTLAPILRGAVGTLIFVVALLVCLSKIGVNTTGLLAISSVAGVAVAFGSQTLVRDIITGLFLLLEDALQVGDAVTLAGMSGTVEKLSIRTIYLRGGDGSVNIIPFSSVTIITNATRDFNNAELAITVGYDENLDHVCALLTDIGRDMRAETLWGAMIRDDLQIFGLDKFAERGMVITAQIRTAPGQNAAVRREFYRRVQQRFIAEGIVIPTQQSVFKLEMPGPETH